MEQNFFRLTPQQALQELHAVSGGLTSAEAAQRLAKVGPNQLAEGQKKSALAVFAGQFKDLLVVILIAAALISMFSGNLESTLVIFAVLILNAVLGTVQYFKAEKSLESLKAMSAPTAKVLRDGQRQEIPSSQVVPGDIIELEAGDLIVADGRLLNSWSLKVNESSLTGESEAVEKISSAISGEKVALGDQKNMVFSGSLVTYGRAVMVVTATGMETQLGRIASLMNQTQQRKTPLQKNLDDFSGKLAFLILVICAGVFLLSVYRSGMTILDSLMFAVALAVAAIPEALSSIVTIVLAMGTLKMARQNAIIKELKAVESLGSVQVICSDKTGTLTQNRMTVQNIWADGILTRGTDLELANDAQRALLKIALLDSDATLGHTAGAAAVGDPTEVALVQLGAWFGVEEQAYRAQHPRLSELAFDSDRKLMSTLHDTDEGPTLYTKGAMDVLLARSTRLLTSHGPVPLTPELRAQIEQVNRQQSESGLRVLAFALRPLPSARLLTLEEETDYTFVGLISMIDPPRPESVHKTTATAIAKQIGIFGEGDQALDGVELEGMSDTALDEVLPKTAVYARVSPEHKIRIVSAWQRRGCVVAMTGDGVNDAPALKKADVGVAMGITGTEVSKDAAAMILADDNFATIVKAVLNGRSVYANIRSAVQFLLSGNMAAILAVIYASLAGLSVPFQPVHLLFINLLTDSLPAIALGMEPARPGLMDQKPRDPNASMMDRPMITRVFGQGLMIGVASMIAFYIGLAEGGAALASTMAFATLTLARLFHGFNCRGPESIVRLGLGSNPYSLMAFGIGILLLALVLFVPALEGMFLVAPLSSANLLWVLGLAFAPTLCIQISRLIRGK